MKDQAEQLRSMAREHPAGRRPANLCRVLTITGGKGGVGKSSVALNLAIALSRQGARVLLFDADLGLANLDLMIGIRPELTLEDVMNGRCRLSHTLLDTGHGVVLLPGGAGIPALAELGSLALVRLMAQLRELEDDFDYILIDTAAGIGEAVARFTLPADDVIVVCTPDPPAMLDAYSVLKMLSAREYAGNLHLVVNMARAEEEIARTYASMQKVAQRYLDRPLNLLGGLLYDDDFVHSVRSQVPLLVLHPQGRGAGRFHAMIPALFGLPAQLPEPHSRGFFSRLMNGIRGVARRAGN